MPVNARLPTLLASALLLPGVALADPLPGDQIGKQVAEKLGVQVLAVTATDAADPPTYAVKVMNPAGNDNAAFLVTTLLVDASTGAILGQLQPAPSAARPDATPLTHRADDTDSGRDLRRLTYR